jgi:hypothetical protein
MAFRLIDLATAGRSRFSMCMFVISALSQWRHPDALTGRESGLVERDGCHPRLSTVLVAVPVFAKMLMWLASRVSWRDRASFKSDFCTRVVCRRLRSSSTVSVPVLLDSTASRFIPVRPKQPHDSASRARRRSFSRPARSTRTSSRARSRTRRPLAQGALGPPLDLRPARARRRRRVRERHQAKPPDHIDAADLHQVRSVTGAT